MLFVQGDLAGCADDQADGGRRHSEPCSGQEQSVETPMNSAAVVVVDSIRWVIVSGRWRQDLELVDERLGQDEFATRGHRSDLVTYNAYFL